MSDTATTTPVEDLDAYVRGLVDQAPPFSEATRHRLAVLLRPSTVSAVTAAAPRPAWPPTAA